MHPQTICPLNDDSQLAHASHVLTLAFAADPFLRWVYPQPQDYLTYLPQLFRVTASDSQAAGAAMRTDDSSGVALWFPPGAAGDSPAIQAILERSVSLERQAQINEALGQVAQDYPLEPFWELAILGVDVAHQNQGHGAVLLKHSLQRCDQQRQAAFLYSSNPKNIGFYQRHGFEIIRTIKVANVPPLTTMLRPAR